MKWFDLGNKLFKEWKKISVRKAVCLFPITILYAVFWFTNFLLFFLQYLIAFPLEAAGIDVTSGISSDDDEYVKKSKLGFGIIIGFFFTAYMIVSRACLYIPIGITALWMDATGVCIFKKFKSKFEITKSLLNGNN